ncbi:hypothetical protein [Thaumasiovibrio sp. DFM-14]|uniref:hypothetical protein n=1 Tax=Thaumasiovibrio sp. DFM-14 TaxID=3384792 RepID=UPI0039A2E714
MRIHQTTLLASFFALVSYSSWVLPSSTHSDTVATAQNLSNYYPNQPFNLQGQILDHQTHYTLIPCGAQQGYELNLNQSPNAKQMVSAVSLAAPIYADMTGYLIPASTPSTTSRAQLVVEHINQLHTSVNSCAQPQPATKIVAHQGDWHITLGKGQLTRHQTGHPNQSFALQGFEQQANTRRYLSSHYTIHLQQASCHTETSRTLYGWRATVTNTHNGEQQYGCASVSTPSSLASWEGHYLSQDLNLQLTTTLTLNADYSATTTHHHAADNSLIVEHGFWQPFGMDTAHVVMTHDENKQQISERLYKRKGYQLNSHEEVINQQRYALGPNGIRLDLMTGPLHTTTEKQAPPRHAPQRGDITAVAEKNSEVEALLRRYLIVHKTTLPEVNYQWLTYDLNQDGHPELLIMLDWCQQQGCTLLVFEGLSQGWRFNSRITDISAPFGVAINPEHHWLDLLTKATTRPESPIYQVSFGITGYPYRPTQQLAQISKEATLATLFSHGFSADAHHRLSLR